MSTGTKIALAVIALFIGANVVYFGFIMSGDDPGLPVANDPVTEKGDSDDARAESARSDASPPADAPRSTSAPPGSSSNPGPAASSAASRSGGGSENALREFARPLARPEESLDGGEDEPRAGTSGNASPVPGEPASEGSAHPEPKETAPSRAGDQVADGSTRSDPPPVRDPLADQHPQAMKPARIGADRDEREDRSGQAQRYTIHTVREGETLSAIAKRRLGDGQLWDRIARANPRIDPHRLQIGQTLRIPLRVSLRSDDATGGEQASIGLGSGRYTVRSGDTLSSIAGAAYGDETLWRTIYVANRRVIGADPDDLAVGMQLRIPPRPEISD